jgi:uncharacterized membrane protein YdjX (TVP38/TMEM64 family)
VFSDLLTKENLRTAGFSLLALVGLFLIAHYFDADKIKDWVETAGIWGPIVIVLIKVSTIVFAPISGSAIYPIAGALYGFWKGVFLIELGDLIGYSIAFWIARRFGQAKVNIFLSRNEEGLLAVIVEKMSSRKGFIAACFVFFPVPELLAYGAGLSRLSYVNFMLIIMPISLIGSTTLVGLGQYLGFNKQMILILFVLGTVGFVGMTIITGIWYRSFQKKGKETKVISEASERAMKE